MTTIFLEAEVTDQDEPVRTPEGLGLVASVQSGGLVNQHEILGLTMTAPLPGVGALARVTISPDLETVVIVDRAGREVYRLAVREVLG